MNGGVMDEEIEFKKLRESLVKEMGETLYLLKKAANAYNIGWDEIQQQSHIKTIK